MKPQFTFLFHRFLGVPVLAMGILVSGLALTAGIFHLVGEKNEAVAQARFDAYKAILIARITHRLDGYAQVLHGAAGFIKASEFVTLQEWKQYVSNLNLDKYYPGLQLMGYMSAQPQENEEQKKYASLVYEASVKPLSEAMYTPTVDSASIRQEAMNQARDQNNVSITKKLVLVQQSSGKKQLGFLMLFPVYQKGANLDTLDERRNALQGYVYNVFSSKDFMQEVVSLFDDYLEVNVYDGPKVDRKSLIYKSITRNEAEKVFSKFQGSSNLLVGNHVWSVSAIAKDKEGASFYPEQPVSIWAAGIILSILFFVASWMLVSYRKRVMQDDKGNFFIQEEPSRPKNQQPLFFAKIFHELRTPLNSIIVLSKLLSENKEKNLTEKQIEQAAVIYQSGEDLLEMVDDVMDLSRIKSGKISVNYSKINIREFAGNVSVLFEAVALNKSIEWSVTVDPSVPYFMYNDEKKLYQIIKNLCSNAIKFTDKGSVSVCFYLPPFADSIAISVTDTGKGISREKLSSIFEPYDRGDLDTDSQFSGSGLGLTISQELAHLLVGEIKLTSQEMKGSCFTLFIPMNTTLKSAQ